MEAITKQIKAQHHLAYKFAAVAITAIALAIILGGCAYHCGNGTNGFYATSALSFVTGTTGLAFLLKAVKTYLKTSYDTMKTQEEYKKKIENNLASTQILPRISVKEKDDDTIVRTYYRKEWWETFEWNDSSNTLSKGWIENFEGEALKSLNAHFGNTYLNIGVESAKAKSVVFLEDKNVSVSVFHVFKLSGLTNKDVYILTEIKGLVEDGKIQVKYRLCDADPDLLPEAKKLK